MRLDDEDDDGDDGDEVVGGHGWRKDCPARAEEEKEEEEERSGRVDRRSADEVYDWNGGGRWSWWGRQTVEEARGRTTTPLARVHDTAPRGGPAERRAVPFPPHGALTRASSPRHRHRRGIYLLTYGRREYSSGTRTRGRARARVPARDGW